MNSVTNCLYSRRDVLGQLLMGCTVVAMSRLYAGISASMVITNIAARRVHLDRPIKCLLLGDGALAYVLSSLNGGQRQLVSKAQALILTPQAQLLDQPTSSLNLQHQLVVLGLLCQLSRVRPMCVVMAVHNINHALRFTDNVVVLRDGEVEASDSPVDVLTPSLLEKIYGGQARVERCLQGYLYLLVDYSVRNSSILPTITKETV